jgi:CxxC-x17-CxxC domain-containing protein
MSVGSKVELGMSGSDVERSGLGNGAEHEVEFSDIAIECIDCEKDFVWSAGAQTFYYDKGLIHPPKRCKQCKRAKNRRLAAVERARINGKPALIRITATCSKCNKRTTIPFYPSQGRPVYCRECFDAGRATESAIAAQN